MAEMVVKQGQCAHCGALRAVEAPSRRPLVLVCLTAAPVTCGLSLLGLGGLLSPYPWRCRACGGKKISGVN